ncbi:MAG: peptidoglycan DD-metalloendopeptidase family protein [Clostridia bacterium]|nr:peptidoglycan DD-metalloendopeptidase family protein [Clostridia bacterium]
MFRINSKIKRIIAFAVVIFMLLFVFSTIFLNLVGAQSESQLKQQQQSLSNSKNNIKSEINSLNEKKDTAMAEKAELDVQVVDLETQINDISMQISDYELKISDVQLELDKATEAADKQYDAYKTRVRVMYENGSTGYLDILLSAESVSDLFERIEIVKQISEYDSNMTKKLRERQAEIQNKKDELEKLKQGLVDSKTVLDDKKSGLDAKMAERDRLIQQIEGSVSSLEAQLKTIEAQEASVRAQLRNLSGSSTPYSGGSMTWPCPSCHIITSNYGWRLHPVLKYEKLHTGIDIGASYGAKIIAAKNGTVVTATYNSAYGNYVVVNHGGGVCTLYAHQSQLAVSVGQYVNEGDLIGYVGSTGYSTGPHLHFEVIINGATTDPLGYVQ